MSFGKKTNGFNLDCVLGNVSVTIVTKCGLVFQGTLQDDEHTRTQYSYPIVFPSITMDNINDKKDDEKCEEENKKAHHPSKPIEVDVKCENEPKFLCLLLTSQPGNICCPDDPAAAGAAGFSFVTAIAGSGGGTPSLFLADDTVLINVNDIVAIGPSRFPLTPA